MMEKYQVIQEHKRNKSTKELASMFQCGRKQIQRILRHKDEILSEWGHMQDRSTHRQTCSKTIAVELILYEWIQRCRLQIEHITDALIGQTVLEIVDLLQHHDFNLTKFFFPIFKKKYKINETDLINDNLPVPNSALKSLELTDIFNDIREKYENERSEPYATAQEFLDDALAWQTQEANLIMSLRRKSYKAREAEVLSGSENSETNFSNLTIDVVVDTTNNSDDFSQPYAKEITSYEEALAYMAPLEEFALINENLRIIGLLNQLENSFKDEIAKKSASNAS